MPASGMVGSIATGSKHSKYGDVARPIMDEPADFAKQCDVMLVFEAADLPPVRAGVAALCGISASLVGNAIKYSHPGGHVRVTLMADATWVCCAMANEEV
jgi:hypothetical protein